MRDKNRFLQTGMTVGQIREELEGLDDDTPVMVASNYGDHGSTTQLLTIDLLETIGSDNVVPTAYSASGFKLDTSETTEEDDETIQVVIFRT